MSEYKRLTVKTPKGIKLKRGRKYVELFSDKSLTLNALNYLAELEDKRESGLLLELPCKVGDVVYYISQDFKDIKPIIFPAIVPNLYTLARWIEDKCFGDWLFVTQEAAEARCKELQEGKK